VIMGYGFYLRGILFFMGIIPFAIVGAALHPFTYLRRGKGGQGKHLLPGIVSSLGCRWADLMFPGIVALTPYTGLYYRVKKIACPRVVAAGSDFGVVITLVNFGGQTWEGAGGVNPVRLGTWNPENHRSDLYADSWLLPNRPGGLRSDVPPGQRGEFTFTCRAPGSPGRYETELAPVADGRTWFPGERIRLCVKVSPS